MTQPATGHLVITLAADGGAGPFWVSEGDEVPDPYDTDEITEVVPLGYELRTAIAEWGERFRGIRDPVARAAHIADGRRLARWIKAEVHADVVVRYVDVDGNEWPVTIDDPLP